ncbi:multicopper oxidase family protein [Paenibacillus sp. BR2-3]|uniref:multicopper oxidase family protein n=1 Tax=Paenibacillus sp. BR2-3 TaxID=3048494 RepID=UPI003977B6C6
MKMLFIRTVAVVGLLSIILTGCLNKEKESMDSMDHSKMDPAGTENTTAPKSGTATANTVKMMTIRQTEFTLTAQASNLEVEPGKMLPVWTFNNSVPGPEIRVKQGDKVKITLKNELTVPVSIHWHGVPVPISIDGVPGVTQNAVQPGQSFVYEFTANVQGTYWYHSHQDSVNQIDRGLYGSFIVEAKDNQATRDYTLMLDEWMSSGSSTDSMNMESMNGMEPESGATETSGAGHDMNIYDLLTINGNSGTGIESLAVKQGDKVRLRLVNAGYKSHTLHLHGHEWKVTATDGQPVNNPQLLKDSLLAIAPGERYDMEFEANNPGQWYLEAHGSEPGVKGMKIKIAYDGVTEVTDEPNDAVLDLPNFDLTRYGQAGKSSFTLDQKYDVDYTMNLGTDSKDGNLIYTINGKTFPNTDPIQVKKGDKVKVRMVNNSVSGDHPMHLHGHFFQVLSKNGKALEGSSIVKDTLNLKPGEEYVVALEADNPGDWMFHCHDLHHASAGMVTDMKYTDYKSDFVADPKVSNKPE